MIYQTKAEQNIKQLQQTRIQSSSPFSMVGTMKTEKFRQAEQRFDSSSAIHKR